MILATYNMPVHACVTAHTALTGYLPFQLLPLTSYLPSQQSVLTPLSLLSCIAHLCKHLAFCDRFLESNAKILSGVTQLACRQTLILHYIAAAGKEAAHNSGTSY